MLRKDSNWKENGKKQVGNSEVQSDNNNQSDRLCALGFKMEPGSRNFPIGRGEIISEDETPGMQKETPVEETYNKYSDDARKNRNCASWETRGALYGYLFRNSGRGGAGWWGGPRRMAE